MCYRGSVVIPGGALPGQVALYQSALPFQSQVSDVNNFMPVLGEQ